MTPPLLRAWLSETTAEDGGRGKPLSPSSVAQAYRTLNRVLAAAVDDQLIARNPLAGVRPPRASEEPMRFLTHGEVHVLADRIDERYRALVYLAAYCGLRAGELFALRWNRIDLERGTLSVVEQVQHLNGRYLVTPPKSNAGRRSVALPSLVADRLETHREGGPNHGGDTLVFTAPTGGYIHATNFRRRIWNPAVEAAGLAPLRLHDLRHTCASLAIAAGADVKVLQRMLGHASAALTLDRYGHLMPGQAESVAARLDHLARAAQEGT